MGSLVRAQEGELKRLAFANLFSFMHLGEKFIPIAAQRSIGKPRRGSCKGWHLPTFFRLSLGEKFTRTLSSGH